MLFTTRFPRLAQMLEQRCFFLFFALLALLVGTPFLAETVYGPVVVGLLNVVILMTAVVAIVPTRRAFMIALLLGLPNLGFQFLALQSGSLVYFTCSWGFGAAFYAFTIAHLLQYVLRRDEMTADKLYGAVAAYVMIAILWAYIYGVLQYFYPGAYAYLGTPKTLDMAELIFYSFTVLTTAGFGDVTAQLIQSRFVTLLEAVTGVMYVAILIARLTGVYPVVGTSPRHNITRNEIKDD